MSHHRTSSTGLARRRCICLAALGLLVPAAGFAAGAFPWQPVRLVLPYPPGGPIDAVARGLADALQALWGQPVVVDSRAGGNEIIAADLVAKAGADGHTLLLGTEPSYAWNSYLHARIPYDPVKDFAPVSRVAEAHMVLIVKGALPVSNLAEFVALNRARPQYFYASTGVGSTLQMAMESFKQQAGFEMVHVAYKGVAPAIQDLLGGRVDALFAGSTAAIAHLSSGRMKVLAISGPQRATALPEVPTFAEQGYPQVRASFNLGVLAPAATPAAVVQKISADIARTVREPAFLQKVLRPYGLDAVGSSPQDFEAFIRQDRPLAAARIRQLGIRLD